MIPQQRRVNHLAPIGRRHALAALACALLAPQAAAAPAQRRNAAAAGNGDPLRAALGAIDQQRFEEARRQIAAIADPLGAKIARWALYQNGGGGFAEIVAFLAQNPGWPVRAVLNRRAEEALDSSADDGAVRAFFGARAPLTPQGALRLADALARSGQQSQSFEVARRAWRELSFAFENEVDFLGRFQTVLTNADHVARVDRMLWDGRTEQAQRAVALVSGPERNALQARLSLASRAANAENAARAAASVLRSDAGLAFEYVRFLRRADRDDEARQILVDAPPPPPERASAAATERQILARRLLDAGRHEEAYAVARGHGLCDGGNYVDAEFLTGWIAFRFLGDARRATEHFVQLAQNARLPVSMARGAYWVARAAEAQGDRTARTWYERAAQYPVAFYGQLAAAKLGRPLAFPTEPARGADDRSFARAGELPAALRQLAGIGQDVRARQFLVHLTDVAQTATQHAAVAEFALELGKPDYAVIAAKRAASVSAAMMPRLGWPVVPLAEINGVEPALVLAVMRQESQLDPRAISPAGARGLMQLMPATARNVAARLGALGGHSDARLTSDTGYNVRLGSAYLGQRISELGGSYLLAVCAYNAGVGRARSWAAAYGDPRDPSVDVIDWMERIPFQETRNYAQRVFENLMVYRWRLAPETPPGSLERDLRRGAIG
jgi:soluble lytic murein transglycosylase